MAPSQTEQASETSTLDDFELVRNGEGQWLLVLPTLSENENAPLASVTHAELIGDDLILTDDSQRIRLQSLIATQYAQSLREDKPATLLLCIVDNDGNNRLLSSLPFRC